ncbi:hypothetical protein [Oceaniglobus roseus]|uniref:hypothetical protein n=1 Tax=Oceaniglobus roseus TaxID=1737570 RepID=UPI000C7F48B7|nr:hypothetical protein [Kandeliimicrobium roseum]
MSDLLKKARDRRLDALNLLQRSRTNMFCGTAPVAAAPDSTIAHLSDYRVRMGHRRLALGQVIG